MDETKNFMVIIRKKLIKIVRLICISFIFFKKIVFLKINVVINLFLKKKKSTLFVVRCITIGKNYVCVIIELYNATTKDIIDSIVYSLYVNIFING